MTTGLIIVVIYYHLEIIIQPLQQTLIRNTYLSGQYMYIYIYICVCVYLCGITVVHKRVLNCHKYRWKEQNNYAGEK